MSELSQRGKTTPFRDFLFVVMTACLTGFAWRARGDHGWGSFKGMAMVACVVLLSVLAFYPYKKRINAEMFPLAVLLTALTNAGYGTFNSQITGVLASNPPKGEETLFVNINPASGVIIMFLVGFGWAPFLCYFIGRNFSDKKRRWWELLITVAVFYAVDYLCRATVSHLLIKLINPQAVDSFAAGLAAAGKEMSPYKAYMSHFSNIAFGKKIQFGRNYFQSIECISSAIGTLAVFIYTKFIAKDKRTAAVQLAGCLSLGASITLADLCIFFADGGFRNSFTAPAWISGWSDWEFFTGFFFGLLIAVITVISAKGTAVSDAPEVTNRVIPAKKPLHFIWNYGALMCFVSAVSLIIPLALRMTEAEDLIFSRFGFEKEEALIPYVAVAGALALIYPALSFTKKDMASPLAFSDEIKKALPVFFCAVFVIYNFFGDSPLLHGARSDYDILTYIAAAVGMICMAALMIIDKKTAKETEK